MPCAPEEGFHDRSIVRRTLIMASQWGVVRRTLTYRLLALVANPNLVLDALKHSVEITEVFPERSVGQA